ncbi:flagellar hook-associated protein FlgK [Effusibacillus pohliae]|uniref:flagellar hook-associated protein FlgK n=1 Tax=Effusibacillus pohliae TaxID=232270 RepID=UPI000361E74B|nr:flagellar hook-associated protein FlgK [Effusibacillus pohliae]
MRSTFHGLEAMKRALYVQQTALNTVSHNVANANTPGYSRQVVDMSAFQPLQYPAVSRGMEAGQLGQGSWVDAVRRVRDNFLDAQYRSENESLGEWGVYRQTLDKIQSIINEPSETGLATVINQFFNAWHDLSLAPEDITARKLVKQRAIELTDTFHHIDAQLKTLDSDLQSSITNKISEVNNIISQIQGLNHQIRVVESLGDKANDLRDRRDLLVDQLSKLVDVKVTETSTSYSINIGGLTVLVDDNPPGVLQYVPNANPALDVINLVPGGPLAITGGEIKGLLNARQTYVQAYQNQIDALVDGLVQGTVQVTHPNGTVMTFNGINGIHETGYTMHNPTKGNGFAFFINGGGPFTAGNIQVNNLILNDDQYITTSDTTYVDGSGNLQAVKGNNAVALMIAQMQNQKIAFSGGIIGSGTVEDYFQAVVGQLGVQSQQAQRMEKNQEALLQQIDNQRQSVSGVSIDEEMADMIKFQHAYNASARVITTIDSILDKIINGMGLTR